MPRSNCASLRILALLSLALVASGCARIGRLSSGLGDVLRSDYAQTRDHRTPGLPGALEVTAEGIQLERFPVVLYEPRGTTGRGPAVVFLPGRFAPEDQYESYARALASRGFVVAVRGRYPWFYPDQELRRDAIVLADWLRARGNVDASRIAVVGHSMGGRNAVSAAGQDRRFAAVVAIDPGTINALPQARETLAGMRAPLLLIGATDAWRGAMVFCGRRGTNYESYFRLARPGTTLLEIRGADHVQVMDFPDALGFGLCRCGTADSASVRRAAREATVQYLAEQLQGAPRERPDYGALARWRQRPISRVGAGDEPAASGNTRL